MSAGLEPWSCRVAPACSRRPISAPPASRTSTSQADARSCVAFPTGTFACAIFSGPSTCIKCKSNRYLSNNACLPVTTIVPNCEYYSSSSTCQACNTPAEVRARGQRLRQGRCAGLSNLQRRDTSGATCPSKHGLYRDKVNTSLLHCNRLTDAQCVGFDVAQARRLSAMRYELLPQRNAVCSPVTTQITHCEVYASTSTCSRCSSSTVLSADLSKCYD